jgi:hypothetical protein
MRIVIEIDGDNVQVHTDRQPREAGGANVIDAGSAPIDLLRQHGEIAGLAGESQTAAQPPRGKQGAMKPAKDTPLNPLRAGQAIARRLQAGGVASDLESGEVIDGGRAPKPPKVSGKAKSSRSRHD